MKKLILLLFLGTASLLPAQIINGGGVSGAATNPTSGTIPVKSGAVFADSHLIDSASFTSDGSGNVHATTLATSGTGPDQDTAIADPACSNIFLRWASTTTANTYKYCDGNSNIRTFVDTASTQTITGKSIAASEINSGALAVAQGGTGTGSTLAGLMRGNASALTAAELSGDCATSGSNAVICTQINGANFTVASTGLVTKSHALTTAGQGFPTILGVTSQKSETTTADANVLTVTPAAAVGTYRACFVASVSAATSGVISWTLSWTDSNGTAQSNIAQFLVQQGTAAPNTTFTTSAASNYHGCSEIDVNTAAASIIVKWVGGGTTTAKVSAYVERVI